MNNLANSTFWKEQLGVLPIDLSNNNSESNFLMVGSSGNFCIQISGDKKEPKHYHSIAWSCNASVYLVVEKDDVTIYNWSAKNDVESVSNTDILADIQKFYSKYISSKNEHPNNVVSFFTSVFNQFRNSTQEQTNPVKALHRLFLLLISIDEDLETLDTSKWSLSSDTIPSNLANYQQKLKTLKEGIQPKLAYILRYASMEIFKETEKEVAILDTQRDLFGNISSDVGSDANSYSHQAPANISSTIVEAVINQLDLSKSELIILDPICGSGDFLLEILKQLKQKNYSGLITIEGYTNSESALNSAQFILNFENRINWNNKLNFNLKNVEDSLSIDWNSNYDVLLMNPPYRSWDSLSTTERDVLKNTLGFNFKGQPNLASAFIYKAVRTVSINGVLGCVVPSSLLTLDSYKNLRDDIYLHIAIKLIANLGNFVFENTHADVSLFVGKKERTFEIPTLIWSKNKPSIAEHALSAFRKMKYIGKNEISDNNFSIYIPNKFPLINDSWQPISLKDNQFLNSIAKQVSKNSLIPIDRIFDVKQGIRQGAKNIFKISAGDYRRLPENEKQYFRAVVDNTAIKNGAISKKNYIWYPYEKDGEIFKTEDILAKRASYFYSVILKHHKSLLEKRGGIMEWWGLSRPRHWQFVKTPQLYSTEFGKSDSFAFDASGEFVAERGNAWVPTISFNDDDYYFYLAILSSDFFNQLLGTYAKQLLSGWDLGKKSTKNIPVPNIENPEVKETVAYFKLVEIGKALSLGNSNSKLKVILDKLLLSSYYPNI